MTNRGRSGFCVLGRSARDLDHNPRRLRWSWWRCIDRCRCATDSRYSARRSAVISVSVSDSRFICVSGRRQAAGAGSRPVPAGTIPAGRRDYRVTVVRRRRVVRSRARVKWQHISIMGVEAAGATSTEHPRVSFPRQINTVHTRPTRTRRAPQNLPTDSRRGRSGIRRAPARAGTRRTGGNSAGSTGDRKLYTEVLNVKVPSSRHA